MTPVPAAIAGSAGCASCRKPIDTENFLVNEVPPGPLPRVAALLSGRMPRQSDPDEVLASFTLARDNGVRAGSVIGVQLGTPAQLSGDPKARPGPSPVMNPALLIALLASPLTPVGEARLAVPSPGRMSFDLAVVLPGALAVLAAVTAVSAWPALRQARLLTSRPQWQPASVTVAAGRAAAQAGLPAPAPTAAIPVSAAPVASGPTPSSPRRTPSG